MTDLEKAARQAMDALHESRAMLPDTDAGHKQIGDAIEALRVQLDAAAKQAEPVMRTCSLCGFEREDACEILNCGLRDWGKK